MRLINRGNDIRNGLKLVFVGALVVFVSSVSAQTEVVQQRVQPIPFRDVPVVESSDSVLVPDLDGFIPLEPLVPLLESDIEDAYDIATDLTLLGPVQQGEFRPVSDRISLNMADAPLRDILRLLAEYSEVQVIIDADIIGTITLRLENTPVEEAWNVVLASKALERIKIGNVYRIATSETIADEQERRRQARERENEARRAQRLETRIFTLRHIVLSDLPAIEGGMYGSSSVAGTGRATSRRTTGGVGAQSGAGSMAGAGSMGGGTSGVGQEITPLADIVRQMIVSNDGNVISDERSNSLIITDVPTNMPRIAQIINELDKPLPLVAIKAYVWEGASRSLKELGIRWGGIRANNELDRHSARGMLGNPSNIDGDGRVSSGDAWAVIDGARYGDFLIGYANQAVSVELELTALEQRGLGKIVSRPSVMTLSNVRAFISSGNEFQVRSGETQQGNPTYESRNASLLLSVIPQVYGDRKINLALYVSRDEIDTTRDYINDSPVIDTRTTQCTVSMNDGDTVAIGGIRVTRIRHGRDKVPWAHSVPVLGNLFKYSQDQIEDNELWVFVTPQIVDQSAFPTDSFEAKGMRELDGEPVLDAGIAPVNHRFNVRSHCGPPAP